MELQNIKILLKLKIPVFFIVFLNSKFLVKKDDIYRKRRMYDNPTLGSCPGFV